MAKLFLSVLTVIIAYISYKVLFAPPQDIPKLDLEEFWGSGERVEDTGVRRFRIEWSDEMAKLFLSVLTVIIAYISYKVLFAPPQDIPKLDLEEFWGSGERVEDTGVRRFRIEWSDEMISDLKHRLKNHRKLTPPLNNIAFQYGLNTNVLAPILEFWRENYNFTQRLEFMNQFDQYKTKIQGLDVHFLWIKPKVPRSTKVLPLILLHGWPGSVREFYQVIPLLTTTRPGYDFVYEIVVPSLPGFGFSDPSVKPGLGQAEMAVILRNLMHRLGYNKYYVQGGDWGSVIASAMATLFPEEVLGYHTNMPSNNGPTYFTKLFLGSLVPWAIDQRLSRVYPLAEFFSFMIEESGYFHLQATKPDTLGVALSDSPAGLAAYFLEKFSTGISAKNREKPDGGLSQLNMDDLIDNLMLYWVPNTATTSARFYAEGVSRRQMEYHMDEVPTNVPTWALHTKNEVVFSPITLMRHKYTNLLNYTVLEEGGHFAALEIPELFAKDVFDAGRAFLEFNHRHNRDTNVTDEDDYVTKWTVDIGI